jgi:arginine utilization protein RocB
MASEQENERAREAAIERLRLKHEAYLKLFGPPGEPTPLGAVVLADLDEFCTTFRESIHMDATGRMDPYTTIYRDGKKAVALRIRKMLEWNNDNGISGSDGR